MRRLLSLFLIAALAALGVVLAFQVSAFLNETERPEDALPAEGRLVPTAMGAIYVEERGPGDGTPVMLVHGSVGWAGLWRPTMDALAAAGYRAIAFDMPPMGFSERDPKGGYARPTQAARLLALADALAVRPVIVAHSFGAGAAAEAAMQAPDRVAGLVVVAGAIGLDTGQGPGEVPALLDSAVARRLFVASTATNRHLTRTLLRHFLHNKEAATDEVVAILQQPLRLKGTTDAVAQWLPTAFETPPGALSLQPAGWQALAVPVAFLWGAEDSTTPLAQGEALAELAGGAPLTVLSGAGHIPQIEAPEAFRQSLLATLATIAPGG